MIAAIHQPQYLSWLGFFNKALCADIFVILDNVQFQKNGFQNRTKIKAPPAWQWLTVPVSYNFPSMIYEVKTPSHIPWQKRHWKTIVQNYQKAPYFRKYAEKLELLFESPFDKLVDLVIKSIEIIFDLLKVNIPLIRASSLTVSGSKTDLLISISKKVNVDIYLSGVGGKEYMEEDKFNNAEIKVVYQDFKHPVYEQQHNEIPFQANMSIVDLIFNCGEKSREIILSGYQVPNEVKSNAS